MNDIGIGRRLPLQLQCSYRGQQGASQKGFPVVKVFKNFMYIQPQQKLIL